MLIKEIEQKFRPVVITLETMEEFKMFTKIIQDYEIKAAEEATYSFSVVIYSKLEEIHSL